MLCFRSNRTEIVVNCLAAVSLTFLPERATANAGIPLAMVAFSWIGLVAFVPVVLVEAFVAVWLLRSSIRTALAISFVANVFSAGSGLPFSLFVFFPESWEEFVFLAFAAICIPFYLLSSCVVKWSAKTWNRVSPEDAARWAWSANAITYGVAAIAFVVLFFLASIREHP